MKIMIRALQGEEMLDALYTLDMYSLHPSPPYQKKEEWAAIVRERRGVTCQALFEDDQPVSIAVSTAMTQNMRGQLFPACGLWGVSTLPAARRKGYCRQVVASLLAAAREAGQVFSNLYPFRESFYERLGYVTFPLGKIARLTPAALAPLLKIELEGKIELKLISEAFDTYREYLSAMRSAKHGMAFFDIGDRAAANRNPLWAALAKFGEEIEGLMLYRIQGEEVTKFNFVAFRFYYRTSRARYLLLNWIARHVDQAERVDLWLPADEYPETWLADLQVKTETQIRAAMSRVLDVEKIGGLSVGEGNFRARISDPLCPWNNACWHFAARNGKLEVAQTSEADGELTIQGLTALIAGTHDPQDFPLRGWGTPSPEIQAVMRTMFPATTPYLHENF